MLISVYNAIIIEEYTGHIILLTIQLNYKNGSETYDLHSRMIKTVSDLCSWMVLPLASTQLSWTIQQASRSSQGSSPGHPECPIPQYLPYLIESAVKEYIRKWEVKSKKECLRQNKETHLLSQFCAMQVLVHSCHNLIQQQDDKTNH